MKLSIIFILVVVSVVVSGQRIGQSRSSNRRPQQSFRRDTNQFRGSARSFNPSSRSQLSSNRFRTSSQSQGNSRSSQPTRRSFFTRGRSTFSPVSFGSNNDRSNAFRSGSRPSTGGSNSPNSLNRNSNPASSSNSSPRGMNSLNSLIRNSNPSSSSNPLPPRIPANRIPSSNPLIIGPIPDAQLGTTTTTTTTPRPTTTTPRFIPPPVRPTPMPMPTINFLPFNNLPPANPSSLCGPRCVGPGLDNIFARPTNPFIQRCAVQLVNRVPNLRVNIAMDGEISIVDIMGFEREGVFDKFGNNLLDFCDI